MKAGYRLDVAQKALNYIVRSKTGQGNWGSTQATIYSLKALLLSLERSYTSAKATIHVSINGEKVESLRVDESNSDVLHIIDLKPYTREGENRVTLEMDGVGNLYYQIVAIYYMPWETIPIERAEEIGIDVSYNTTNLTVNDIVDVKVKIEYRGPGSADMVVIDLGVPPGFSVIREDLEKLVGKFFDRVDVRGRQIIIYMEKLEGSIEFSYRIKADMPIKTSAPSSQVYKYYDPDVRSITPPVQINVAGTS